MWASFWIADFAARKVFVPFVGTVHDRAALALARRLLENEDAELTVLHVRKPDVHNAQSGDAPRELDPFFEEPAGGRVTIRVVHGASPVRVALSESLNGYDLV